MIPSIVRDPAGYVPAAERRHAADAVLHLDLGRGTGRILCQHRIGVLPEIIPDQGLVFRNGHVRIRGKCLPVTRICADDKGDRVLFPQQEQVVHGVGKDPPVDGWLEFEGMGVLPR